MSEEKQSSLADETAARIEASRKLALLAAEAAMDKKAIAIEIINVADKVDYADYLVLATGTSDRHCAAVARGIDGDLSKLGHKPLSVEGETRGEWVLIDLFDVVVHVFSEQARDLYDLSGLWMDAKRVPLPARKASDLPSHRGN